MDDFDKVFPKTYNFLFYNFDTRIYQQSQNKEYLKN